MNEETKTLYRLTVNWHGEVLDEWGRYENPQQARHLLLARLSVRLERTGSSVRAMFNGKKNNFTLEEVIEGKPPKFVDKTVESLEGR